MKVLKIFGRYDDEGFTFRTMSGDAGSTDAYNTLMQVLRQGKGVQSDVLIWDEGTWDEYVWG